MSVFSKLKLSKKAAKQHKGKGKEKEKQEEATPVKAPYKHIPTHAAFDALSGAPSHWKYDDRSKIKEQHRRRSQMAISRTGSSLSATSYMNPSGTPSQMAPPPRNSSYNSYNPAWFDRGAELSHTYERHESVPKRQKPSRRQSYHESAAGHSMGRSPLASNIQSEGTSHHFISQKIQLIHQLTLHIDPSPVVSSGNSTTSNSSDNLEMPPNPRHVSLRPQPMVYEKKDIFDRLHTSKTRKVGEAPQYDSAPILAKTKPVPAATTTAAAAPKQKKNRWSLLGKKHASTTIAAM